MSEDGYKGADRRAGAGHWEKAIEWVDGNKDNIRRYSAKFLPYSAYTLDDFLQEALTAAHEACCLTSGRRLSVRHYAGFFWTVFHSKCCDLAGDVPRHLKVPHETAIELKSAETLEREHAEGLSEDHAEAALSLMPARQAEAWRLLLDGKSQRQASRLMGVSEQAVSNSVSRGFERLKEAVSRVKNANPRQHMIKEFAVHLAMPGTKAGVKRKMNRRMKKTAIPETAVNRQTELLLTLKSKVHGKLRKAPLLAGKQSAAGRQGGGKNGTR